MSDIDGELDDLFDHLVINAQRGEIRYWKNGKDIAGTAAIENLIARRCTEAKRQAYMDAFLMGGITPEQQKYLTERLAGLSTEDTDAK